MESQSPPPIQGGNVQAPGSKWPTALGVIAIIFGIGGILQAVIAPFSAAMTKSSMQVFVDQGADQAQVDDFLVKLQSNSYLSGGICLVLGVILLVGGIMVLKRKPVSSVTLQAWAVLKILGGGFMIFKSMAIQKTQMEIMFTATGGSEAEMIGNITKYAMWFGLGFGFLWLIALPVFILIWFNREKIKTQMGEW
ncbi:MAG: hypothetical protein P1U86_08990 [Verrucomicrobiales bacterium]|nr:hypothetical protein [Verrucomicrobiales bacterium]